METAARQWEHGVGPRTRPDRMPESIRTCGFRSPGTDWRADIPEASALLGAGRSGKSNVIRFFGVPIRRIRHRRPGERTAQCCGGDTHLFRGRETTPEICAEIDVKDDDGACECLPALALAECDPLESADASRRFCDGSSLRNAPRGDLPGERRASARIVAAAAPSSERPRPVVSKIADLPRNRGVCRFRGASPEAGIRMGCCADDWRRSHSGGGSLASVRRATERERPHRYVRTPHVGAATG